MNFIAQISDITSESSKINIDNLLRKKIYFAHKSVGYNIIDGMQDLMKINPEIKINIRETYNHTDYDSAFFGHSANGENGDPKSKIDNFVKKIENGLGNKADIAFLKLCYVDIRTETDIEDVFKYYTSKINALKKKYPKTLFVHCTVPLTTYKKRTVKQILKDAVKSVVGKQTLKDMHLFDNIKRNQFNEMLKKYYSAKEIFDIAEIESTYKNGNRELMSQNDKKYYSLIPDYTYDGGHLTEPGRMIIAEKLLFFLSTVE